MAGSIKGITVEINGEAKGLLNAIRDIEKNSRGLNSELKQVNNALKLDPKNTVLLAQKTQLLGEAVTEARKKLDVLKSSQEQVNKQFERGEISAEQYRAFQREIISTERALTSLQTQQRQMITSNNNLHDSLKKVAKATADVAKESLKLSFDAITKSVGVGVKGLEMYTKALTATAGAITTVMGGFSTKVGANFEKAMSNVGATMGMTSADIRGGNQDFKDLSQAAIDAGMATKFSATEAAEALNFLALAGYDSQKQIGALPVVLDLAIAGEMELGLASDMLTDSMSALGISTDKLSSFSDQLAKTAQKSNTNVSQLGEALITVGGTAKNLAGGTVELNTALGILADNGIKAGDGGTALRQIILNLTAPTDVAKKKMTELGVSAFNADGSLRPLNDTFRDLDNVLKNATDEERMATLSTIFDARQLKSAEALLANYGDRWDVLSSQIANSEGAMKGMANTMADNLKSDFDILKSSMETLGIAIYQGSLVAPLRSAAQQSSGIIVDLINDYKTAGLDGLIAGVLQAVADNLPKILDLLVQKITVGLPMLINAFNSLILSLVNMLQVELPNIFTNIMPSLMSGFFNMVNSLILSLPTLMPILVQGAIDFFLGILTGMDTAVNILIEVLPGVISDMVAKLKESLPKMIKTGFEIIQSLINGIMENLEDLLDIALLIVLELINGLITFIPQLVPIAVEILNTIVNSLINNLPLLIDVCVNLILALVDGFLQAIPILIEFVPTIVVEIVIALIEATPLLIEASFTLISSLVDGFIGHMGETDKIGPTMFERLKQSFAEINWAEIGLGVLMALVSGFDNMTQYLKQPLNAFINMINMMISSVNDMIMSLNNIDISIPDWVPGVGGNSLGFNIPLIPQVPMLAKGGILSSGTAIVGEAGPELLTVGSGRSMVQPLSGSNANGNDLISEVRALRAEFSQLNKKQVTIQSNMDGKTIATQTASFSDVINGLNMQYADRGLVR